MVLRVARMEAVKRCFRTFSDDSKLLRTEGAQPIRKEGKRV